MAYLIVFLCMGLVFVILPLGVLYLVLENYYKDLEAVSNTEKLWVFVELALSISPLIIEEILVQETIKRKVKLLSEVNS